MKLESWGFLVLLAFIFPVHLNPRVYCSKKELPAKILQVLLLQTKEVTEVEVGIWNCTWELHLPSPWHPGAVAPMGNATFYRKLRSAAESSALLWLLRAGCRSWVMKPASRSCWAAVSPCGMGSVRWSVGRSWTFPWTCIRLPPSGSMKWCRSVSSGKEGRRRAQVYGYLLLVVVFHWLPYRLV